MGQRTPDRIEVFLCQAMGYIPFCLRDTLFSNTRLTVILYHSHNQKTHTLELWDPRGEEGHDRFRPLVYPDTSVVILCFSLTSRTSFENLSQKWIPEVTHFCPGVPRILVGTHADAGLDDSGEKEGLVSVRETRNLCSESWDPGTKF